MSKVVDEALRESPAFIKYAQTARMMKWLFASVAILKNNYSISGREHLVARGLLSYYNLISTEGTGEWIAYVNTGRTGRIDTKEVRDCLTDLANQIIIASGAEPLDQKRYFSQAYRKLIFQNSGGSCSECGIELSETNFHADHKNPIRREVLQPSVTDELCVPNAIAQKERLGKSFLLKTCMRPCEVLL